MGNENESTTKFKVDISELKSGIQEANRQIRLANAEFKAASSSMEDWGNTTDGVGAKIKQLESVLDGENKKLASLKKQLELVEKEQGENSKGADELRIAIANQQASVNKTEKSLNGYKNKLDDLEKGLDDVSDASKDAEKNTKSLGDGFTVLKGTAASLIADGIKGIASSIVGLVGDTREYRNEMAKLETAFTTNGHSVEAAKGSYEELYGILGDEGQAVEAANFLSKLTDNEKELSEWTNICAGVYGQFGASLPIEGLTEAANETAKVGQVTGPLADALNWTTMSAEKWNTVLSNNPKAMKAFNAGIKEGMSQEDAFNEALSKCSTEQERQQLIMGSLSAMYGESAAAFKETNSATIEANKAQSALTDSMAQLGAAAEPVVTSVKQGFADLLTKALELFDGADFAAFGETISNGFDTVINTVLPAVKEGFQWIIDNKDMLIAGLAGIAAGFVAFNVVSIIQGVVGAFKAFKAAQEGATVAQWLLNAAMNANPVGLIVAAIMGLVTAFVVLWNKSEAFRNFWIGLWDGIKNAAMVVWDAIKTGFSAAWDNIKVVWSVATSYFQMIWDNIKAVFSVVKTYLSGMFKTAWTAIKAVWDSVTGYFKQVWETIKGIFSVVKSVLTGDFQGAWEGIKNIVSGWANYFKDVWNNIKGVFSAVKSWFSDTFSAAWNAIKNVWNNVQQFFSETWNKIKSAFKVDEMLTIGKNIVEGIKNGISNAWNNLKEWFSGLFGDLIGIAKKILGIKSPSRVFRDQVGKMITKGLAIGIDKGSSEVEKVIKEMNDDIMDDEMKFLSEMTESERDGWNKVYAERLAAAENATERQEIIEQRAAELLEKGVKDYETALKTAKSQGEKIVAALAKDVETAQTLVKDTISNIADETIDKVEELEGKMSAFSQKSAENIKLTDTQTRKIFSFPGFIIPTEGIEQEVTVLSNLSEQIASVETRNKMFESIKSLIPENLFNELLEMSTEEAGAFINAFLSVSPEQQQKYVEDYNKLMETIAAGPKQIFADETQGLINSTVSQFDQLPTELFDVGTSSAQQFGEGFIENVKKTIADVKTYITTELSNMLGDFDNSSINASIANSTGQIASAVNTLNNSQNGTLSTLKNGTSTVNTYNFTQNNTSPKALSRLEIYRQTKNQLAFAKGV